MLVVRADVARDGAGETEKLTWGEPGHVAGRAGADPDAVSSEQGALEQHGVDERKWERAHGAGLEASDRTDAVR